MKSLTFRKLSLMGLVLMAASAVTAAILPKDDSKKAFNGVLVDSTGGCGFQKTCINAGGAKNCTFTAVSATTGGPGTSAVNNGSSEGSAPNHHNSSASPC